MSLRYLSIYFFFFFNDTATTEIYTLSLHDALPICLQLRGQAEGVLHRVHLEQALRGLHMVGMHGADIGADALQGQGRSEEHTSELQSPCNLVCRLLLEKKKPTESRVLLSRLAPFVC